MTTLTAAAPALHVSLHVADLARSIAFYRDLFELEPAKVRDDYAKFELASPPLVLALVPSSQAHGPDTRLSHLGIRLPVGDTLAATRSRLVDRGHAIFDEGETVCCYAEARKVWVDDPDGNSWELYEFLADADRMRAEPPPSACSDSSGSGACCG